MIFIIQYNQTIYMQFTACLYIFYQETHLLKRRHLDVELRFQKLVMKVSFLHKEKHLKGKAWNTVIKYLFFIIKRSFVIFVIEIVCIIFTDKGMGFVVFVCLLYYK